MDEPGSASQAWTYRVAVDLRLPEASGNGYVPDFEAAASSLADQLAAADLPVAAVQPLMRVTVDVEAASVGQAAFDATTQVEAVAGSWMVVDSAVADRVTL